MESYCFYKLNNFTNDIRRKNFGQWVRRNNMVNGCRIYDKAGKEPTGNMNKTSVKTQISV